MGRAIALTFGARGFDVTLITRNRAELSADGITAAALPAEQTAPADVQPHLVRLQVKPGIGARWAAGAKPRPAT
jgi:NAD(P)-dependent dehydrogenase (short-subunit alcohol dehydrogenase family)